MRLLFLTDRISHRGGASKHLLQIIRGMHERHTVTVASGGIDAAVRLPANVQHIRLQGLRAGTPQMKGLARLPELLSQTDVVHLQNVMNPTAIEMAKMRPCVATIQDHRVFCPGPGRTLTTGSQCFETMDDRVCKTCLPEPEQRERMLRLTQARNHSLQGMPLIVLSTYMANEMEQAGHPRPTVIPPTTEMGPPKESAGHGFLMAGRLVHHKGIDLGHKAWQEAHTDHPLRSAGLGPAIDRMGDVDALGWLDTPSLRSALQQARALIFPSRWQEPFGIIGVESLAMGTPVIAMSRGGMPDWMGTGTISVGPNDVQGMAAAISTLGRQPDRAMAMGRAGQRRLQQQPGHDAILDRIEDRYEQATREMVR